MNTRQPDDKVDASFIQNILRLHTNEEIREFFECDAQDCAVKIKQLEALFKDSNPSVAKKALTLRGYMHRFGIGGAINYLEAIKHYEESIKKYDCPSAKFERACMHEYGRGAPINLPEALKLYKRIPNKIEPMGAKRAKRVRLKIEAQQLHEKIKQRSSDICEHAIKPDAMHAALEQQADDECQLFTIIQRIIERHENIDQKKKFRSLINQILNYPATISDLLKHPEELGWLSEDMPPPYLVLAGYIKTYLEHQKIKIDYVERVKNCLIALQSDISSSEWKIKNWQGEWVVGLPTHITHIKNILDSTNFSDTDHILKQYTTILKILHGICDHDRRHPHTSAFYTSAKSQLDSIFYYNEPAPLAAASTVALQSPLQLTPAASAPAQPKTPPPDYAKVMAARSQLSSTYSPLSTANNSPNPGHSAAAAAAQPNVPIAPAPTFFSPAPQHMPAASTPVTAVAQYNTQTFAAMFPPAPTTPLPAIAAENRQTKNDNRRERVVFSPQSG